MARFLHTADLHLGRSLYGERLLEDQAHILDQLQHEIAARNVDALLIAGDVFDRSVPPAEAIELLDQFLFSVAGKRQVPIVLIPGNHDSADRLGFGARLLANRLHIASSLSRACEPLVIEDEHGSIELFGLPFLEPARVREFTGDDDIRTQHDATAAMVARIHAAQQASRSILVAHAFVQGGQISESERPLSIGGLDTVDASVFSTFNYVALGHLHRPQAVGQAHIQYAGSPMKYSTSEIDHNKSFTQIDMDANGACQMERIPITTGRNLVRITGTIDALLTEPQDANADDLIVAHLLDKGPVHDAMNRLRGRWPNTVHIERSSIEASGSTPIAGKDHRTIRVEELFSMFFESVNSEDLNAAELDCLTDIVNAMPQDEGHT